MILIVTGRTDDPTVVRLSHVLRTCGADPVVIAPTTMEACTSFSLANGGDGGQSVLRLEDRVIDLKHVHAAWLWRGWSPHPLDPRFSTLVQDRHAWAFFQHEWAAFHKGLSLALAYTGAFCVNPPPFNTAFEEKCCQLLLAAEVGLRIPPTLYTTRLPVAREFYDAHQGSIIYKPFRPYLRAAEPQGEQPARIAKLYTNRVQGEHLVEGEDFVPTPGIFQPYVDKRLELRIVVVGQQLFACAIHSQASARSREDWRRYDFPNTPYEAYNLPAEVTQKLLRLTKRLGLVFGSIDMIVTPEQEYVFLEINPNGQFDWIARLSGLPIYEHLAAMLLAGSSTYPTEAIAEVPYVD